MKYYRKLEIEDPFLLDNLNLSELARISHFKQPHLSNIKNNKLIISFNQYIKLAEAVKKLKTNKKIAP